MIKNRPFFITVLCVYLLASATFFLVTTFNYLNKPETEAVMEALRAPYLVQVVMLFLNPAVMIVAAILMWEESNWGRWLYLGWGFLYIDYNLYNQRDWHNTVIGIGIYLVFALILLVPSANEYFSDVFEFEEI